MTAEVTAFPNVAEQQPRMDIEFVFTKLNTKAWQRIRVLLQRRATIFAYNVDKSAAYAGFKITPENAHKVADVYIRIYNWKTIFVHVPGTDVETPKDFESWGHCWIMAHATKDKTNYCQLRDYDPELHAGIVGYREYLLTAPHVTETNLTLPCKCVRWKPNTKQPNTYKQQYLDAANVYGCTKCPFFNISGFNCSSRHRTQKEIDFDRVIDIFRGIIDLDKLRKFIEKHKK